MPRIVRSRRSSSPVRRTNWVAKMALFSDAGSAADVSLINSSDAELEKYVSPTLVRVRGTLLLDPDAPGTATENHSHMFAYIYFSPTEAVVGSTPPTEANLASDQILWVGGEGYSRKGEFLGGATQSLGQVWLTHRAIEVDIKSMRKLEDIWALRMKLWCDSGSGVVPFKYSYVLRFLLKE